MAFLSVLLLYAGMTPPPLVKAAPIAETQTRTANVVLMATVIVVPPTQVVNPMTGKKDNQTILMYGLLNGQVANQADNSLGNVKYVQYPQAVPLLDLLLSGMTVDKSRDIGAANLNQTIDSTSGKMYIVGYSQGSSVNTRWLDNYMNGMYPDAPDPANLTFVNVGNPNRPNGGGAERFSGLYIPILDWSFDGATPSNTPYKVIEVAHEYDGFSDFPKDVWNLPAVVNAVMGMGFVHAFYDRVDLNDPNNIVTQDGNLTDVLVHTSILPIMQPLYIAAHLVGRTQTPLLDAISEPLRVIIDSGYDRTTAAATPANFGMPFQNLKMEDLKAALDRSAQILKTGESPLSQTTTFSQFPDLSKMVQALTSPGTVDMNQAAVQSAEQFLYGTPKAPVTPSTPVEAAPPVVNVEANSEEPKAPTPAVTVPDDKKSEPEPAPVQHSQSPEPVTTKQLEPKLTLPKINLPKLPSIGSSVAPKPTPDAVPSDGGANKSTPQQQTKPVQKFEGGLQKTIDKVRDAITPNVPPPGSASQPSESSINSTQAPRNGLQQKINDTVRNMTQGGAASSSKPDKADAPSSPGQHDSPSQHEGGDS